MRDSHDYRVHGVIVSRRWEDLAPTEIQSLKLAIETIITDQGDHLDPTIYIEEAE